MWIRLFNILYRKHKSWMHQQGTPPTWTRDKVCMDPKSGFLEKKKRNRSAAVLSQLAPKALFNLPRTSRGRTLPLPRARGIVRVLMGCVFLPELDRCIGCVCIHISSAYFACMLSRLIRSIQRMWSQHTYRYICRATRQDTVTPVPPSPRTRSHRHGSDLIRRTFRLLANPDF